MMDMENEIMNIDGGNTMRKQIAVLAISVMLAGTVSGCTQADAKETTQNQELKLQSVQTIQVEKSNLDRTLSYSGVLSPKNVVHVVSAVPGEILEVPVRVGDTIEKDGMIYSLNKENVERSLRNAQLTYQAAQHQLNASTDQHEIAVKSFERTKSLYESPSGAAVSKSQYEQAELGANGAGVEGAKVQVAQAKIGLEQAQDQMADADLKSPISGTLSALKIEAGQTVGAGQHIADVINMDQVYVDIQVAENVINSLKGGDKVAANIPAVTSEPVIGTIDWVSPAADIQTRLFPVRVLFDNKEHTIKPGMFVNVGMDISEAADAIVIPSTAILDRTDGKIVYVNENGKALAKYVTVGFDNGELTVIQDGLDSGENLIVEGQQFIENGTPLKVNGGE